MGAARGHDFPQQTQKRGGRQGYRERFKYVTSVWVGGGQPGAVWYWRSIMDA